MISKRKTTVIMTPRIIDVSHYETITNLKAAQDFGIWGIIAKATQGTTIVDAKYNKFRQMAKNINMLFGAYHFNNGDDPHDQFDFFLENANPDKNTLMALDFEKNEASRRATNMTIHQMVEFLRYGEQKLGHKLVIYSGNYLKENIQKLNAKDHEYVTSHRLWLAQYSNVAILPDGFKNYWIWQYTGDGIGPRPHYIPGIAGEDGLDINTYKETQEQLIKEWAS